jgi:outer membrane immunogenic protein
MKKLLLAGAALLSLGTAASAADLPARPYAKAAPLVSPGYDWSGFYIGVMGGGAWSDGLSGGFGGGTIGYNWQLPASRFVFGIEVDAAGASIKDSQTEDVGLMDPATLENKISALGSVTGRAGYALDAALLYVKGGFAWADNKATLSVPGFFSFSDSHVHSGYTVGAGVEYMFAPSWSAKAEYMYVNLSSKDYTFGDLGTAPSGTADFHTIKAGINYHFR